MRVGVQFEAESGHRLHFVWVNLFGPVGQGLLVNTLNEKGIVEVVNVPQTGQILTRMLGQVVKNPLVFLNHVLNFGQGMDFRLEFCVFGAAKMRSYDVVVL